MINHARTLITNRDGGKQNLAELGEEYIPATFRTITLPIWLRAFWEILYGSNPENTYRNYVTDRLLRVIAATNYSAYLTTFDTRLTYDPKADSSFEDAVYQLSWSLPSNVLEVQRLGDLVADESGGTMSWRWTLTLVNGTAILTHMRTGNTVTADISNPGDMLTGAATLPDSNLRVRLAMDSPLDSSWDATGEIKVLARPATDLTTKINKIESLGSQFNTLFGLDGVEPYLTFRNLWESGSLPERVAGLVLAMIYRMDELFMAARVEAGGSQPAAEFSRTGSGSTFDDDTNEETPDDDENLSRQAGSAPGFGF